jgi:glycosyltransferase involved in cell wall biosynthesis
MQLTYLVLTHNEPQVKQLLAFLFKNINEEDDVVVLDDYSDNREVFSQYLDYPNFTLVQHKLDYSYSEHRNYALPYCKGDYILALDADETLAKTLFDNLKVIINDLQADVFWLPRANQFEGVTDDDCRKFGWNYQNGLVNFPDYQCRLFKNYIGLAWQGVLHERLKTDESHKQLFLKPTPELALIHKKSIDQQRAVNTHYNEKYTINENRGLK